MKFSKKKLWFLIFFLGFLWILSMLTVDFHLEKIVPAERLAWFEKWQINLLLLINPMILLAIATTIWTLFYDTVDFKLPILEKILGKNTEKIDYKNIVLSSIFSGILAGVLIVSFGLLMKNYLPETLFTSNEMSIFARFLYGGIFEEILIRFGLMTLLAWIFYKIFKKKNFWIFGSSIIFSAIIFGIWHLPELKLLVGDLSPVVIFYTIFGNFMAWVIFGYLYYKKWLEAAMLAHIVTHIVLVLV